MWVRPLSGDSISFVDHRNDECCGVSNSFLGTLPTGHLLVQTVYEDGITVSVIDPRNGGITRVNARPIPSPNGRFFAAADEEGLADDLVTVWRLDTGGSWVMEHADAQVVGHMWAPRDLHWVDDSTLTYSHDAPDSTAADVVLVRSGGRWLRRSP